MRETSEEALDRANNVFSHLMVVRESTLGVFINMVDFVTRNAIWHVRRDAMGILFKTTMAHISKEMLFAERFLNE